MKAEGFQRVLRVVVRTALAATLITTSALLCFLPFAGRYLVAEDALERSDAIVVLAGPRAERWLEAAELFRAGWAPRIILSPGRPERAEVHLREIGIRFPAEVELARDALIQMKVPADAVTILPGSLDNTAQEAAAAREAIASAPWGRIIVVTSKYHTRRTGFAFARAFRGTRTRVLVRASRYDYVTPERWWADRADVRYVTSELQKLLAYRLGLGE
jgi:uncharacterized SAM-binding protein YcdF (DUF218 family)